MLAAKEVTICPADVGETVNVIVAVFPLAAKVTLVLSQDAVAPVMLFVSDTVSGWFAVLVIE